MLADLGECIYCTLAMIVSDVKIAYFDLQIAYCDWRLSRM